MGIFRWIKQLMTPPPTKVELLVMAQARDVHDALRALPAPLVHVTERETAGDRWSVLVFEGMTREGGNSTGLVAILAGRVLETEVTLIGLGGESRTKGGAVEDARKMLERFPVVPNPTA